MEAEMNTVITDSVQRTRRQGGFVLVSILVALGALGALAGGHLLMMRGGAPRPAASEFGLGPRTSSAALYTGTLIPTEPLQRRKLQQVQVAITDAQGAPVENAQITVHGGMPQHGHGLPTRPRVTRHVGNGIYEIEGVRFNMGGWWEFTLAIATPAGTDRVTFNLSL
jgi:hypothetical protein